MDVELEVLIFIITQFHIQEWEFGFSYHHDLLGFYRSGDFTRFPNVHGELNVAVGDNVDTVLEIVQPALELVASSIPFEYQYRRIVSC